MRDRATTAPREAEEEGVRSVRRPGPTRGRARTRARNPCGPVRIARLHQVAAEPAHLAHQLGWPPSRRPSLTDLLLAAKHLGLKAKLSRTTADRLALCPLPALAVWRDETAARTVVLAQCDGQRVLFQDPPAPARRPPDDRAARRLRRAMDRRAHPDHQPRQPGRRARQVRLQLVHPEPRQVPPAARRSAGRLAVPAALRAGQPAVLPGRDGQGARAPRPDHARRAGHRPGGRRAVRERARRRCAPTSSATPPAASTSSSARGCSATWCSLPLAYFQARRVGDSVARVRELENIRSFLTGNALTAGARRAVLGRSSSP